MDKTEYDITVSDIDREVLSFGSEDFVILGIPVYSGRVPNLAKNIISSMHGKETPIALIATYGNRNYDDALLELKTIMQSNGFLAIAAAAFVAEHSVVQKFGAGRPNDDDLKVVTMFSELLGDKIAGWDAKNHSDLQVKGNPNYREYKSILIKPHAKSSCTQCGLCSKNCPASAISQDNPKKTDRDKCVTCVRCIRICPSKARNFYYFERVIAEKSLKKLCSDYKQPEIFL
jgi:ferredoxin